MTDDTVYLDNDEFYNWLNDPNNPFILADLPQRDRSGRQLYQIECPHDNVETFPVYGGRFNDEEVSTTDVCQDCGEVLLRYEVTL